MTQTLILRTDDHLLNSYPVLPCGLQPHLGKQAIARWYMPPEVDYRLSLLPKDCKGLVVWMIECKVHASFYETSTASPQAQACGEAVMSPQRTLDVSQVPSKSRALCMSSSYTRLENSVSVVCLEQVLSKTELQFLALLPALRPKVKVIAECGPW